LALSQLEAVVTRKRIKVYIEYQSVCPFVVIESPHPRKQVCPPPLDPKGEGATLPCE
jgi:hypothetical protein